MKTVSPWTDPDNPWLQEQWENVYKCNLSDPLNRTGRACVVGGFLNEFACPLQPRFTSRMYDAVNAFAIALHRLINENCAMGFRDKSILTQCISGPLLLKYLYNSSFEGVAGKVHFNSDGSSVESFIVRQFQRKESSYVGTIIGNWNATASTVSVDVEKLVWVSKTGEWSSTETSRVPLSVCSLPCHENDYIIAGDVSCCWTCVPCRDDQIVSRNKSSCETCPVFQWPDKTKRTCSPIEPTNLPLSHPILICLLVMSAAGILSSLAVMTTFVIKRHHKLVMATSLPLSMIILSGTLLVAVGIIAFVVPPTSNRVCVARSFGFHGGISLIYVPLFVKNMRIYRIFSAGASMVSFTSNRAQIMLTAIIAVIQVILMCVSEAMSPSLASLSMPSSYIRYVEAFCFKSTVWFLIPLTYNIVLMLVCAVIGFITRKVPANFNESWFIFISVTTTLFAWIVFIPSYFTARSAYMQSAILGFCLVLNCCVTLGCQFVPIVYAAFFVTPETIKFSATTRTIRISVAPAATMTNTASTG